MMQGAKSVRKLLLDRAMKHQEMARRRKAIEAAEPEQKRAKKARMKALEDQRTEAAQPALEQAPVPPSEPVEPVQRLPRLALEDRPAAPLPEEVPVPDDDWNEPNETQAEEEEMDPVMAEFRRSLAEMAPAERQRLTLDDEDEESEPAKKARVTEALVTQVMLGTLAEPGDERANEWVSRYELDLLRQLTGLPLSAARLHKQPRKRLARPPKLLSRGRLSILIGKDPRDAFVVEETPEEVKANPRRKASFPWKGIAMYYREKPPKQKGKALVKSSVEKEGEVYQVNWSSRQRKLFGREWLQETKDILLSEVMLLRMKQSGKELDPKFFDKEEKAAFDEADAKEWQQWIQNGVVKRLTPKEARKIPRDAVFRSPMRMVRTNKQQKSLLPLIAKSRLVIPGHTDPHLGMFRTDAPTTSLAATKMAKAISQRRRWQCWSFDVTTAFLSGLKTERRIFAKAPADGLPPAESWDAIMPYELLQILKSAYGLTEAPRLWYLRAVQQIHKTPLRELAAARATFVAAEKGVSWAILCLRVDDGLLMGNPAEARFQKLKADLNGLFKIKEWKTVPLTFLGIDLEKGEKPGLWDSMATYVKNIKIPYVEKKASAEPLNAKETTCFRQLVMRLRWPAQQTMPHLLYSTSSLAQRVNRATYGDFDEAVKLHKVMVAEAEAGRARLHYPETKPAEPFVLSFFDVAWKRAGWAIAVGRNTLSDFKVSEVWSGSGVPHKQIHQSGEIMHGCRLPFHVSHH